MTSRIVLYFKNMHAWWKFRWQVELELQLQVLLYFKIINFFSIYYIKINWEVPAAQVLPRCADAHNFLGPTLKRWHFLRLFVRSSASPRTTAVWQGFWNSDFVVLESSIRSWALPCSVAVQLGFWNSGRVVLKSNKCSSASPRSVAVWLAFSNSDHVVLKLSKRTSALPWR